MRKCAHVFFFIFVLEKKSERPVDALAVKKRDPLTDNLKSRDASASKKQNFPQPGRIHNLHRKVQIRSGGLTSFVK